MEYHANDWLGRWQNFEAYLTSSASVSDPCMAGCRDSCRSNAHVLRRSKGLLAESLRDH